MNRMNWHHTGNRLAALLVCLLIPLLFARPAFGQNRAKRDQMQRMEEIRKKLEKAAAEQGGYHQDAIRTDADGRIVESHRTTIKSTLDEALKECGAKNANPDTTEQATCMKDNGYIWSGYQWKVPEH